MLVLDRNMQFMDSISRDCDSPSWYFSTGSIAYLQTFGPASNYFISMYFFHLISICLCNPPVSWKVQPWMTTPSVSKAGCASYKTFDHSRSLIHLMNHVWSFRGQLQIRYIYMSQCICIIVAYCRWTPSLHGHAVLNHPKLPFWIPTPQPPKALTSRSKFSRKDATFQATS